MKAIGAIIGLALMLLASSSVQAREYLKSDRAQSRGFSPAVVTEGGKVVWVSGHTGLIDEQGKSMAGDFQKQFNEALKEAELDDVKKSVESLRGLNPAAD